MKKEIPPIKAAGGLDGLRLLVDEFYLAMDTQESSQRIRAMH